MVFLSQFKVIVTDFFAKKWNWEIQFFERGTLFFRNKKYIISRCTNQLWCYGSTLKMSNANFWYPISLLSPFIIFYPLICSHVYCYSNISLTPRGQYHQCVHQISFIVWWHWCKWWRWRWQYNHLRWYRRCWCSMRFPFTFTSSPNMMLLLMRLFLYWL